MPAVFDPVARRSASSPRMIGVPGSSRQKSATGGDTATSPFAVCAMMSSNDALRPTLGSE